MAKMAAPMVFPTTSSVMYKLLRGVLAVYKPPGMSDEHMVEVIRQHIVQGLNKMPLNHSQQLVMEKSTSLIASHPASMPTRQIQQPRRKKVDLRADEKRIDLGKPKSYMTGASLQYVKDFKSVPIQHLEDHELSLHKQVLGDSWEEEDVEVQSIDPLSDLSSGITVIGVRPKENELTEVQDSRPIRVYRLKAELGRYTVDYTDQTKTLAKYKTDKITRGAIDRVCAALEAGYRRAIYLNAGLDISSHEAYEATCKGLIRPAYACTIPSLYSLKCRQYKQPNIMLEAHVINETPEFMYALVDALGAELNVGGTVKGVRRIRYGHFNLDHCLVYPQWNIEGIWNGIESSTRPHYNSLMDRHEQYKEENKKYRFEIGKDF